MYYFSLLSFYYINYDIIKKCRDRVKQNVPLSDDHRFECLLDN